MPQSNALSSPLVKLLILAIFILLICGSMYLRFTRRLVPQEQQQSAPPSTTATPDNAAESK